MPVPAKRHCPTLPAVPLALWPAAQTSPQDQFAGYPPACAAAAAPMLPELARRIVKEYTSRRATVVGLGSGATTTVIEAALLGRRAIGITPDASEARAARSCFDRLLDPRPRASAQVRIGGASPLSQVLSDVAGRVNLICISGSHERAARDPAGTLTEGASRCCPPRRQSASGPHTNESRRQRRLSLTVSAGTYRMCLDLLRPGGILVTLTTNSRRAGRLVDRAGTAVALARDAGFYYLQHVVVLVAEVREAELAARPST